MPIPTNRDFSVQFGKDPSMGLEKQKSFPFIYTFVNHNDDTWQGSSSPLTVADLASLGPTVPAASQRTHYVILDPDYNFKLISIRYSAYALNTDPTVVFSWYENTNTTAGAGGLSDGVDPDMDKVGTPLYHYIRMSLSFQCSGSQFLFGGQDPAAIISGASRIPLQIDTDQGYEYGIATVRRPFLLPRQGHMVFEITNTHPTLALTVAAAIYGMKIRI